MESKLCYTIFKTDWGWVGLLSSAAGLRRVTLPQPSLSTARAKLGESVNRAVDSPDAFRELIARFRLYFSGRHVNFPDRLDLSHATDFQRRVWEVAKGIPYGETRSYGWIARQMGKSRAARAVGAAMGSNPIPIIIPCHRVLGSDGGLCGFGGGLEMKRRLLALEGYSGPG